MLEDQIEVTVIDSKNASYAIGIIVTQIAQAAQKGKSAEECIQLTHQLLERTVVYFLVDSLVYLEKGGRIGKASAMVGSLLNIKPILSLDQSGQVYAVEKVRGSKRALTRMIELLQKHVGQSKAHVGICHASSVSEAEQIEDLVQEKFQLQSSIITYIGPVIGTHVGPKTIGITMCPIK